MGAPALRSFPCHPSVAAPGSASERVWATCPECGSRLRVDEPSPAAYDDRYPEARAHHDPVVGGCKVRTLERWLGQLGIRPEGEVICEIGFGGGQCLEMLQRRGAFAMGIEPVPANRSHAARLGIPPERLFDAEPLPSLPRSVTLWIFQDSFEHVEDPAALVQWMAGQSSARGARVLLVAPDAESTSRRMLGPLWVHGVPDHWVHYSRSGILAIFGRHGFRPVRPFRPLKCVSLGMAIRHLGVLARRPVAPPRGFFSLSVWFNVGEMGLLMARDADRRETAARP